MASTERDSTVIVPDNLDEVRARLEERRKKQLERAKQARADYEKRMEEEKAAAAKRAEEAKNAPKNKGDGTKEYPKPRTPGEKSPHQKQNGGGKGGSAPGVSAKGTNPAAAAPKASAIDANAKFLAAAAARAADIKDGKVPAPTIGAGNAQKPKGAVPAAPKSFEEVMAEKAIEAISTAVVGAVRAAVVEQEDSYNKFGTMVSCYDYRIYGIYIFYFKSKSPTSTLS